MCFSAPASFIASGALGIIGGSSLAVASRKEKVLAFFPLIFAIQQLLEGVQWLALHRGAPSLWAGYGFLFFAYAFWPLYVPLAVYIYDNKRRKFLKWPLMIGSILFIFFMTLIFTHPLTITDTGRSISYDLHAPLQTYIMIAYFLAVLVPLLTSSNKFLRWFGLINIVLASMAGAYHMKTFASVWCFFAAISSTIFFIYLKYRPNILKFGNIKKSN